MELSDLQFYRESEQMIVLPWRNGCRSGALVHFDNTIATVQKALQVCDLREEQAGVKIRAAHDA